jgi:peptide/nickel transport system permease protein
VQAVGLIFAAVYIFLNMAADIISILANPRLRHPK